MNKLITTALLAATLLSGCKTFSTYSTIPISNSFSNNSKVYVINRPNWKVDSAYDHSIGSYQIMNFDSTFSKVKKDRTLLQMSDKLMEEEVVVGGSDTLFLPGFSAKDMDDEYHIKSWDIIKQSQSFSFDLTKNNQTKWSSECQFSQQHYERTDVQSKATHKIFTFGKYQCDLHNQKHKERLTIEAKFKKNRVAEFINSDFNITVEPTVKSELEVLDEQGVVYYKPGKDVVKSAAAGYYFKNGDKILGALSLGGHSGRIWLSNDNSNEVNELLLSASYSALIFEWKTAIYKSGNGNRVYMNSKFKEKGFRPRY
jgi:hypothetical protein